MRADQLADNSKRFSAYLIDVLPITAIVLLVFYFFLDFDEILHRYLNERGDQTVRKQFLQERNWIRNISLMVWVIYGTLMDASGFQGTFGKYLLKIRVADYNGNGISLARAFKRNVGKLVSVLPLFIGVLWILFDEQRRGLHDKFASTVVLKHEEGSIM